MVITSKSKKRVSIQLRSAQFRYSILYVVITFAVLLYLNIYCSKTCQNQFYNNKKATMTELCHIAASNVADLDVLNRDTVSDAVTKLGIPEKNRLIVTNNQCLSIYDSRNDSPVENKYALYPVIVTALEGNTVFYWSFHDGIMYSYVAAPVVRYGTQIGCVYITECDAQQGAMISSLQNNILTITIVLEIAVILFSLFFSNIHIRRLRKIMTSIRNVRNGDYTHKLQLNGHDELNMLSNEFDDLIDRLQTSEQKRNRFVSDASHELKTPLASIKLLSDSILQNSMDPETVNEFVGDIGAEADRLNRMSQKLLTLSGIDNRISEDKEIVYIAPTIERVIRMLSVSAKASDIQIKTDLSQDQPILILEDDLYQVIFNLVENGIKYNRKGGTLTVALEKEDEDILIKITDTGVGIPEESLSHIFERFYRVDKARSRSTGGSGLGLSIVRNIIRRNKGEIQVESTVGVGTTMCLRFPVFPVEEELP